jgi:hypothetical protein
MATYNWGGPGYATYEGFCKVSSAETSAYQAQANAENAMAKQSQAMVGIMNKQFAAQQSVLNVLMPQLTAMAKNPQGFGAQAMAAMTSQMINTIGTQLTGQQQGLRQQFATSNMPGLGSGAEAAISSGLASSAAGAEASNIQQLDIANAQAKMQQQQFALSGMSGLAGMMGSQAMGAGGMAMQGLGMQGQMANSMFQNAYTMNQQGSGWQNALTGALTGAGMLLGTMVMPGMGTAAGGQIGSSLGGLFGSAGGGSYMNPTGGGFIG